MVWSVPSSDEGNWFNTEFGQINRAIGATAWLPRLDLRVHITRAAKDAPAPVPPFYHGRPDMTKIMGEISSDAGKNPVFVFVCGPKKMVNSTWDLTNELMRTLRKPFEFHHETFEF